MNTSDINLDSLIEEAQEIKKGLTIVKGDFYLNYYELKDNLQFEEWVATTHRYLMAKFPGDPYADKFEGIAKSFVHDGCYPEVMDKMIAILSSCKTIPVLPQKTEKARSGINVNVNQTQQQAQTQEQILVAKIFLESIKDEIKGKEFKEIKEIIETEKDTEKAKQKIRDKIKTWGESVVTNIVANILTNPALWSCFF